MGNRLAQGSLVLLLFFPFIYYPVSAVLWLGDPEFASLYKEILAGFAFLLTVGALARCAFLGRKEMRLRLTWRSVVLAPEFWGVAFLGWIMVVSLFHREPSTLQNLIVYTVFVAAILLAHFVLSFPASVLRIFVWLFVGILLILGVAEAFADPMQSELGKQMGGPRLYASYGVIGVVGLFAIPMKTWLRIVVGMGLFAGAVISSSRSSMTTLLVVLLIGLIITAPHVWRRLTWVVSVGLVLFFAVLQLPWLRAHMAINVITTPGLPFNDSGRGRVWIPTLESWLTQPVFGLGAGSSQTVSRSSDFPLDHPHSEYLRILHDAGIVGFIMFAVFVVFALMTLWPRAGGRPRSERVIAGFLIVIAGLVLGTIENFLVFPSLMWPAAVFLGLGLVAARRDWLKHA